MIIENFDIDELVQNILADLGDRRQRAEEIRTLPEPISDVYLESRVISLADIRALGDSKKLFISPKSILTPSAKDEIRKRRIALAVKLPRRTAGSEVTIWLAAHRPAAFSPAVLKRFNVKPEYFESVTGIVESALRKLSDENRRGAVLSRQAATLLCEANRHRDLRAFVGINPKQAAEDAAELDANLLVLHPDRCVAGIPEIIDHYIRRSKP